MEVFGLTGGIGTGKSRVAALLEDFGIPVVSADELARIVVMRDSPGLGQVIEAFGKQLLTERGELDRRGLARIVFSDDERRKELEAILHPLIRERYNEVLDALEKAGHKIVVYEVPLLYESGLEKDLNGVIVVTAPEEARVARVVERDSTDVADVLARMHAQMPEEDKLARAGWVIENDGSLDDLRRSVQRMIRGYFRQPDSRSGAAYEQAERRASSEVTQVMPALLPEAPSVAAANQLPRPSGDALPGLVAVASGGPPPLPLPSMVATIPPGVVSAGPRPHTQPNAAGKGSTLPPVMTPPPGVPAKKPPPKPPG